MKKQEEEYVEFRYYEMPRGRYDLALLGEDWICEYGRDPLHFHNYLEIGYCYFGDGYMCFGDEKREYHSGTVSIIPSNFPHRTQGGEGVTHRWEYLFVDVVGLLKKFYPDNQPYRDQYMRNIMHSPYIVTETEYPKLAAVIGSIFEENREEGIFFKEAINGYLLVLLQEIARLSGKTTAEINCYEAKLEKIRGALEYIEVHYADEIKIGDLAAACHVSESYFRKIFIQCMNVLPLEYVNLVRIQKACDLMLQSDDSLESLAWKVGFSSHSTFMRNFKKIVGETPKRWILKNETESKYVHYHTKVLKGW